MIWRVCIYARTGDYPARKIYHSTNTKSLWLYYTFVSYTVYTQFQRRTFIHAARVHSCIQHTPGIHAHILTGLPLQHVALHWRFQRNGHSAKIYYTEYTSSRTDGRLNCIRVWRTPGTIPQHNRQTEFNTDWYRAKQIWYSIISIWQYFDVPSMGKCIDRWYATCGGMKSNWHLSRHQTWQWERCHIVISH